MPNSAVAQAATTPVRRSSLIASLVVCAASTATVVLGWALRLPELMTFGVAGPVAQPLDVVGLLFVCAALIAVRRPAPTALTAGLLLTPALIATVSVLHDLAMPGDRWDGIPAILGLLVVGVALLWTQRVDLMRIAALTAALAASLSLMALGATLHATGRHALPEMDLPLPTVIPATVLAAALLIESCAGALAVLARQDATGWRNLSLMLPVILVAPALILVVQTLAFPGLSDPTQLMSVVPLETLLLGAVIWWLITGLVTERMATHELARALDNGPVVMIDSAGTIVHWSRGCEDLYGWPAALAIGRNKYALLHSHRLNGQVPLLPGAHDPSGGIELIEQHRDGHELRVLEIAHSADGASKLAVLSISDITARAAAERALGDSETRLLLAAQAHSIGVFEWDTRSNAIHWVGNTEMLLGIPPGTIRDYASWAADVFPEDLEIIRKRMAAAIWAKADRFSFTYRMRRPDGEVRTIEGSSRCFYDEAGHLDRAIGVNIDVTERVANET